MEVAGTFEVQVICWLDGVVERAVLAAMLWFRVIFSGGSVPFFAIGDLTPLLLKANVDRELVVCRVDANFFFALLS